MKEQKKNFKKKMNFLIFSFQNPLTENEDSDNFFF